MLQHSAHSRNRPTEKKSFLFGCDSSGWYNLGKIVGTSPLLRERMNGKWKVRGGEVERMGVDIAWSDL